MNSITTKGGDKGFSSLFSGERVRKSDAIFEALGTLDELNSWLGLIKLRLDLDELKQEVETIQRALFQIASNIATSSDSEQRNTLVLLCEEDLTKLEHFETTLLSSVKMPETFIIPGINENAALTDIARTVCRRSERRLVMLSDQGIDWITLDIKYVNRLSDVIYVLARYFEKGAFKERK